MLIEFGKNIKNLLKAGNVLSYILCKLHNVMSLQNMQSRYYNLELVLYLNVQLEFTPIHR